MTKPNNGSGRTEKATWADLRHILGEMDDETAVAILALNPTLEQVEEVGIWLNGDSDILGKERHPFDTVVAKILDMIKVEEDEPRMA